MKKKKKRKKENKKEGKKRNRRESPIIQLNPLRRYLMGRDDVTSFWTCATNHRRFTVGCKKRRTTRVYFFFLSFFPSFSPFHSLSLSLSLSGFFLFIHLARSFSFFRLCFSFPFFFLFFFDRSTATQRTENEQRGGGEKRRAPRNKLVPLSRPLDSDFKVSFLGTRRYF